MRSEMVADCQRDGENAVGGSEAKGVSVGVTIIRGVADPRKVVLAFVTAHQRSGPRQPGSEPMNRHLTGIDHLIVGVRDLEAARASFARLGFSTTPRGRHQGWGTANYCIMLERDYLELLGIIDPSKFTNRLDERLARAGETIVRLSKSEIASPRFP